MDDLGPVDLEDARGGMCIAGRIRICQPARAGWIPMPCSTIASSGGDLLAGRHHGVISHHAWERLPCTSPVVGLAGHRRHHHGHVMAGIDLALHMARDVADAVDVGDGRAAEFHHEAARDDDAFPLISEVRTCAQNRQRGHRNAYT